MIGSFRTRYLSANPGRSILAPKLLLRFSLFALIVHAFLEASLETLVGFVKGLMSAAHGIVA
jgi:hypothetical protein